MIPGVTSSIEVEAAKAKQGKVTGIIIPPPEIRAVADKTAQFVARNGKSFEQKILASEEGKTAKFNFMKPFDPYHAYYEFKISEFEEGKVDTKPKEAPPTQEPVKVEPTTTTTTTAPITSKLTTTAKASLMSPIAKFAQMKVTNPPYTHEFSLGHPSGISAQDMDIIKLTAQYTAVNGREFLAGLAQREIRNPQFDFLKPTHLLFSYFTSLVDAYAKILHPTSVMKENLEKLQYKMNALELSVMRWVHMKDEAEKKYRESAEADAERIAFNSIDWHDFVVVETINFPSDELVEFSALNLLGTAPLANQLQAGTTAARAVIPSQQKALASVDEDMDMDMDMEDDSYISTRHNTTPATTAAVPPPPPPMMAASVTSSTIPSSSHRTEDVDMEDDDDEDMKVVSDYRPRIASTVKPTSSMTMVDPLSGKIIPVDEMSEHMRVALLDPKWRVEQQRFQDKQRETGYAEGSSIADSLKQFAQRRGDIFGHKQVGLGASSSVSAESGESSEVMKTAEPVQWDGHKASIPTLRTSTTLPPPPPVEIPVSSSIGPALPGMSSATIISMGNTMTNTTTTTATATMNITSSTSTTTALPAVTSVPVSTGTPIIAIPAPLNIASFPIVSPITIPPVIPTPVLPSVIPTVAPVITTTGGPIYIPPAVVPGAVVTPVVIPPPPPLIPTPVEVQASSTAVTQGATKKARVTEELISPEEFITKYPNGITIRVTIPIDSSPQGGTWGLRGQSFFVPITDLTMTIKALKELVSLKAKETGAGSESIPSNRFQLKDLATNVFLKDANTVAIHNIADQSTIELAVKSRR